MQYFKKLIKPFSLTILLLFFIAAFLPSNLIAQAPVLQVTNIFNQQSVLYGNDTFAHTAWKPVLYTDSTYIKSNRTWLHRKFFEEHLLQIQKPAFNVFGDVLFDIYGGASKRGVPTYSNGEGKSKSVYMYTRGYELSGNVGDKFYFQTDFYENQGRYPGYVDSFIRNTHIIPFENSYKNLKSKGFDWSYSSAKLIYTPNKHLLFNLGYGTNFIGDGYRSLLLSDYNTSYPYLRTSINFGKVQYSVMYSQYITNLSTYTYALGYPRKWGQTYLLDWQATKHFNIGVFNAVVSSIENADHKKDFGITHFSPIIFLHSSESPSGLKNNDIYGLNLKYAIVPSLTAYGQFMLDKAGSTDWEKRYGFQIGLRGGNLFKIDNLNAQLEFNTVRPYSYASDTITTVYAHNNQPLAHPLGANFKEGIFIVDYTYNRWWLRVEAMAARYGTDTTSLVDYGQNIYKPLYLHSTDDNVTTGQGLHTKLFYGDVRIAYIFNKKTNMRLEGGATYRKEENRFKTYTDVYVYFGVRMTFRKLFYDY